MIESRVRHELKHYINYADILQLRARLPFMASLDKNAEEGNGYRVKSSFEQKLLKVKAVFFGFS